MCPCYPQSGLKKGPTSALFLNLRIQVYETYDNFPSVFGSGGLAVDAMAAIGCLGSGGLAVDAAMAIGCLGVDRRGERFFLT